MARNPTQKTVAIPDYNVSAFYGINTSLKDLKAIPKGVSPDSKNWVTGKLGDHIELRRGQALLGKTRLTTNSKISGLGVGTRYDGVQVPFFTHDRMIKYYDSATDDVIEVGTNTLPALANGEDTSIVNYQGIAGSFAYISSPNSSVYKIPIANPGSLVDLTQTNYKGFLALGQGRLFLWARKGTNGTDHTGLYLSYIDHSLLSQFTAITGEAIGSLGSTTYTGTLAFKAGGAKRTCMYIQITEATGETLTDDRNGNLIGTLGSTGTIDYATGAYSITFNHTTAGAVTADYFWEDATNAGVVDFSFNTTTRVAGTGNTFRQDDGGGDLQAIFNLNNIWYCFHILKTWQLDIPLVDTGSTNLPFRSLLGIPYHKAAYPVSDGILYLDNTNPAQPKLRKLSVSLQDSTNVVPASISDELDLSGYDFSSAVVFSWGDYDILCCKNIRNGVADSFNGTMFIRNNIKGYWDKLDYECSSLDVYNGTLLSGDSLSPNLFTLFSGYDDDGSVIDNFWTSGQTNLGISGVKRTNRMVVEGLIQKTQNVDVLISTDGGKFTKVFNISGAGSYVDVGSGTTIGAPTLGSKVIGGGGATVAYPFEVEFRINTDKYENIAVRFEAKDVGYVQINEYTLKDNRYKGRKSKNTSIVPPIY